MNVIHTYPICHVCIVMWPTPAVASHYIIYYIVGKYVISDAPMDYGLYISN